MEDSPSDEVKNLLQRIQLGDQAACNQLFQRYKRRIFKLLKDRFDEADTHIRNKLQPEDVSQSVWRTFFRRSQGGEFEFQHWDAIWSLLALITKRKFRTACKYLQCQKRDPGMELTFEGPSEAALPSWQGLAEDPTADEAAAVNEEFENLRASLPEIQRLALDLHIENPPDGKRESEDEHYRRIANQVGKSSSTVRRWIQQMQNMLEKTLNAI